MQVNSTFTRIKVRTPVPPFGDHPQGYYTISRAGQVAGTSLDANEEPSHAR